MPCHAMPSMCVCVLVCTHASPLAEQAVQGLSVLGYEDLVLKGIFLF